MNCRTMTIYWICWSLAKTEVGWDMATTNITTFRRENSSFLVNSIIPCNEYEELVWFWQCPFNFRVSQQSSDPLKIYFSRAWRHVDCSGARLTSGKRNWKYYPDWCSIERDSKEIWVFGYVARQRYVEYVIRNEGLRSSCEQNQSNRVFSLVLLYYWSLKCTSTSCH